MSMTVGIDISKDWLDVCRIPDAGAARFPNTDPGHMALIAWLAEPGVPVRVIFEATGAYHRALQLALERAAQPFCKVNPRQARRFAQAIGRLAKTDRLDAAMLARMGEVLMLEPQRPQGEMQFDLNALSAARRALVKERTALLARRSIAVHALVQRQLDRRLEAVKADIAELDAALASLVEANAALRARQAILVSIPGIAETSAVKLLAEMPELGRIDGRQAASLAGLAPITRSSGRWQGHAFIGGGRAELRRALYMPALAASRHNPELRAVYERLLAAGKPKMLAIVAIMRKLLLLANALIRDSRTWTSHAA